MTIQYLLPVHSCDNAQVANILLLLQYYYCRPIKYGTKIPLLVRTKEIIKRLEGEKDYNFNFLGLVLCFIFDR